MKKDPLGVVSMLAEMKELEQSRQVADSIVRLSAERERLALLEQYLADYQPAGTEQNTDIDALRSRQNFLNSLAAAIGDQSASVEQMQVLLARHIETWRAARASTGAVNKLTQRRRAEQTRFADRQEQNEIDSALRPARR